MYLFLCELRGLVTRHLTLDTVAKRFSDVKLGYVVMYNETWKLIASPTQICRQKIQMAPSVLSNSPRIKFLLKCTRPISIILSDSKFLFNKEHSYNSCERLKKKTGLTLRTLHQPPDLVTKWQHYKI